MKDLIFCFLFLIINCKLILGQEDKEVLMCFASGECKGAPANGGTVTPDRGDCLTWCKDALNCNYFTWYSDNLCLSFATCPELEPCGPDYYCFSGERACEGKY